MAEKKKRRPARRAKERTLTELFRGKKRSSRNEFRPDPTTSTWLMMSAGGTPIGENEFAANMAAFEAYSFIYSGNAANYHGETEFTLEVSSMPDSWLLISRIELIFQSN